MKQNILKSIKYPLFVFDNEDVCDLTSCDTLEEGLDSHFLHQIGSKFSECFDDGEGPDFLFDFCDVYRVQIGDNWKVFPFYLRYSNVYKEEFYKGFCEILVLSQLNSLDSFSSIYNDLIVDYGLDYDSLALYKIGGLVAIKNKLNCDEGNLNSRKLGDVLNSLNVDDDLKKFVP